MEFDKQNTIFKRGPRLSEQVADFLLDEIKNGRYLPGDSLPPESKLAEKFAVSRTVIREAMARLKYAGLLESQQGMGARITRPGEISWFQLDVNLDDNPESLVALYELRAIIEGDTAALAAERRKNEHLDEMVEYLMEMERVLREGGDGSEADAAFHQVVATASGNQYLSDFSAFIGEKLRELIRRARDNVRNSSSIPKKAQEEHEAIYKAILVCDPIKARGVAVIHLQNALKRQGIRSSKNLRFCA